MNAKTKYLLWTSHDEMPDDLKSELSIMTESDIYRCFSRNLSFGTGGLRAVMGAGTNRINQYTISQVTRGVATYLEKKIANPRCAVAFDTRTNSRLYANIVSKILASRGIEVHLFCEPKPTPLLSFATRYYNCDAGIVITASHNTAKYNGYKVYDNKGCQISQKTASLISREIEQSDILVEAPVEKNINSNKIIMIDESCEHTYYNLMDITNNTIPLRVVYSPLHGTGLKSIASILDKMGNIELITVDEQTSQDGNFPTCKSPNPESAHALQLAYNLCLKKNADIFFATDPDSDRIGVGQVLFCKPRIFSGNELGILLFDFICKKRIRLKRMPNYPIAIKTIVSSEMALRIADKYGVKLIDVLTGFKNIGEVIGYLDESGETENFIFGFEESCGYLSNTIVRDKDAVSTAALICEMTAEYKIHGKSLDDAMSDLYEEHGYYLSELLSFDLQNNPIENGTNTIMQDLRNTISLESNQHLKTVDYLCDETNLPKSDMIKITCEYGILFFRPSGTEPNLKVYLHAHDEIKRNAEHSISKMKEKVFEYVNKYLH